MILLDSIRTTTNFYLTNKASFIQKAFAWSNEFEVVSFLNSNIENSGAFKNFDLLIGVGCQSQLFKKSGNAFDDLKAYHDSHKDWLFGFLSYDLKNDVESLQSNNEDHLGFPEMHFFQPEIVIEVNQDKLSIHSVTKMPFDVFQEILNFKIERKNTTANIGEIQKRILRKEYLKTIESIKNHIVEGDIYELNFCQEFYAEQTTIDPYTTFQKLNQLAKAPFSSFYKLKEKFLLCSSPERYLKKTESVLLSQPIKGTIRRGENEQEDQELKHQLFLSEKDRAENVMIVDLVRNDLARVSDPGSVEVEELFGIYPFEQVFQMISTVKSKLKKDLHFVDALQNTFPMGSMTGAPKIMAMELIEQYEKSKRGVYSGAVGYITPEGDFDFNVVIRSMLYNQAKKYLSFQVGGAIVYDSVPELEYEECLLKAKAILMVLESLK